MLIIFLLLLPYFSIGYENNVIISDEYHISNSSNKEKCVPITMEICKDLPYKEAIYPNLLNHQTQEEAAAEAANFASLVTIKCSNDLPFFFCSLFAPLCNTLGRPIPPCRHTCESSRRGCIGVMSKFGHVWPSMFECSQFPVEGLCVGENRSESDTETSRSSVIQARKCPQNMQVMSKAKYSLFIANTTLEQCSLPCTPDNNFQLFFDAGIRRIIRFWTGAWAVTCCASSLFTILTFSIDMARFPYPVRPIFYLAICYLFISFVYMIGLVAENKISCAARSIGGAPLVSQGMESFSCAAVGVMHHYFSIASSIWWVVLCVAWFLAANLKWAQESIEGLSSYFHFFAWGIPALLCIVVLVSNSIDGDFFTGICSVGNLKPAALFNFVFVPLFVCIAFGLLFLGCGIMSMLRIRKYIKIKHSNIDHNIRKLEKLMLRICAFAFMYTLPTMVSTACIGYEAFMMESWLAKWVFCSDTATSTPGSSLLKSPCIDLQKVQKPEPMVYLFKYLFQLVVGITCAVWVCSGKTLDSYSKAYARLIYGRSRVPTRSH